MRAIARSLAASIVLVAALTAAPETILDRLAKLSSALTDGNASVVLGSFDSSVRQYEEISRNVDAITAQADVVCAIDVISETEKEGAHHLDTDWVLQVRGKAEHGPLEQRRERIQLEMRQVKGRWKITSISSATIFAPLRVP